jgi:hypothetical protein
MCVCTYIPETILPHATECPATKTNNAFFHRQLKILAITPVLIVAASEINL